MLPAVGVLCSPETMIVSFDVPALSADTQRELITPSLLVWPERIDSNIARMVAMAGDPERLRPHCKTHKMIPVVERLVAAGVRCHKAATVVEVDMLCRAGAADVVLAGNPVGPSLSQLQQVMKAFPDVQFSITTDAEGPIRQLSAECQANQTSAGVLLDVDVGLHRTGIRPESPVADSLYTLTGTSTSRTCRIERLPSAPRGSPWNL